MTMAVKRLRRGSTWLLLSCWAVFLGTACGHRSTLRASLTDQEFWSLSEAFSEPAGTFAISDNLVSNELRFAENVRWLRPAGGVYIGVGPEQNFSYIARLRPAMAFIVDIRRENRSLHLLYKALFELSADRADFVSRLFSRARPADLSAGASVDEIFERFSRVPATLDAFTRNAALVRERLVTTHRLPLSEVDLQAIDRAFGAFYADGPEIQFWGSRPGHGARPSYRRLMTMPDLMGQRRSFLTTSVDFEFLKEMQSRNLILPMVGDFGGPTALRRVGDYVRTNNDVIRAFYGSNVGVYLNRPQTRAFCKSLATLPVAPDAWFIESDGLRPFAARLKACGTDGQP